MVHDLDEQVELVAGRDGAAKLGFVDAEEIHQTRRRVERLARVGQDAADLRERFDDEHPGKNGAAGEMPGAPPLVVADHLVPGDALAGDELRHAIHHHERIAVRQDLEDLRDVDLHGPICAFTHSLRFVAR